MTDPIEALEKVEIAFNALEEYGNQEAMDELHDAVQAAMKALVESETQRSEWQEAARARQALLDRRDAALERERAEADHWSRIAHDRLVSANQLLERARKAEAERDELRSQKWDVKHVDTMNDLVAVRLSRDEAEAKLSASHERVRVLEKGLNDILGGVARPVAVHYAADKSSHKGDQCPHGRYTWDDCEECVNDSIRALLDYAGAKAREGV